jgi:hypothetical protein
MPDVSKKYDGIKVSVSLMHKTLKVLDEVLKGEGNTSFVEIYKIRDKLNKCKLILKVSK